MKIFLACSSILFLAAFLSCSSGSKNKPSRCTCSFGIPSMSVNDTAAVSYGITNTGSNNIVCTINYGAQHKQSINVAPGNTRFWESPLDSGDVAFFNGQGRKIDGDLIGYMFLYDKHGKLIRSDSSACQ